MKANDRIVKVIMWRGAVQDVQGLPIGWKWEVDERTV